MNLRFLAGLIAIAASFGAGLLAFSPRVERPLMRAETSAPRVLACASPVDRDCLPALPGRDIEVIAPAAAPKSVTATVAPDKKAAEPPSPASPSATALATEPAPAAATPAPTAAITPHVRPPRRAATADVTLHEPAPRKTARREPAAKRRAGEAMRTVRRFGDDLRDIPVSSYAADGSRRNIVIRPTNIQDVYYYSVPR